MKTAKIGEVVKKLSETVWVMHTTDDGVVYHITSDKMRLVYTIWEQVAGGFKRLAMASNPGRFFDKYLSK